MNKSILEEIYYSDCGQLEKLDPGKEYWRLHKEAGERYDKLNDMLSKEQRDLLYQYWESCAGTESEWGYANFCTGIKIGMRLVLEALVFDRSSKEQKDTD